MPNSERSVADVRSVLKPHGLEVRELEADTSTAELAAAALGTAVGSIVKSLVFYAGGEPVLVLAAGDRTVDPERIAGALGSDVVRLATPSEVTAVSGYRVGGVPPVGHLTPLRTLMDRRLLSCHLVYAAAGAPNAIFTVEPGQLARITRADVCDLSV